MNAAAPRARGQRRPHRSRRWCIPAAILRSPGEALDGVPVLHDLPRHTLAGLAPKVERAS